MLSSKIIKLLFLIPFIALGVYQTVAMNTKIPVLTTITHVAGCEPAGRWCYAEYTTHYTERPEEVKYYSLTARDHAKLVEGSTGQYYRTKFEASPKLYRGLSFLAMLVTFCLGVWALWLLWDVIELIFQYYKDRRLERCLTVQRAKHRHSTVDAFGLRGGSTFGETKPRTSSTDSGFMSGWFFGLGASDNGGSTTDYGGHSGGGCGGGSDGGSCGGGD